MIKETIDFYFKHDRKVIEFSFLSTEQSELPLLNCLYIMMELSETCLSNPENWHFVLQMYDEY
jgi:hypothetical protein